MSAGEPPRAEDLALARTAIEVAARVGLTFLLVYWCFSIARPFLVPIVWGLIIAVAVHPAFLRLRRALGGRSGPAATLVTGVALLVLIGPLTLLARALVGDASAIAFALGDGALSLPPPPGWLGALPVIGPPVARFWQLAATNLAQALGEIGPQLRAAGLWLLGLVAGAGFGVLNFLLAVVIAGVLLAKADAGRALAEAVVARLAGGDRGPRLVRLAERTVRNVARGVLGTALIQATLAGLGLIVADVPAAAFLTLLCFLLCVVQIGPALVLLGAVVYTFSVQGALAGFALLAWSVPASTCDNVIRPYLLSRGGGGEVPVAVILIGPLGGLLAYGLIGLFVGPLLLAVGCRRYGAWPPGHPLGADHAGRAPALARAAGDTPAGGDPPGR
jgi:predicted PurR-regulated permease PerM